MSIIFIEANATGTTFEAMRAARDLGFSNIFVTMDREFYGTLPDNPLEMADVVIDSDTYNASEVLRAVRCIDAKAVIAFDDYHLLVAAMCAMALGLPHADIPGLVSARYKDLARECTRHLPGAVRSQIISDMTLHEINLDTFPYPVVIKPLDESGSVSVRLCSKPAEVVATFEEWRHHKVNVRRYKPLRDLLMEEYVEGEEYSCELFWDKASDGWRIAGITKKLLGPPPYFVECGHLFPAPLAAALRVTIEERVLSWLSAVGLRCGAAHVEFRLKGDNPYLIEINPRLPGGHITELVRWCTGIDLIAYYLSFHLPGLPLTDPGQAQFSTAAVRFFLSSEVAGSADANRLERHFATMLTFQRGKIQVSESTAILEPRSNYDRRGYAMLAGATTQAVDDDLASLSSALTNSIHVCHP
jgi:biotin carboxylase